MVLKKAFRLAWVPGALLACLATHLVDEAKFATRVDPADPAIFRTKTGETICRVDGFYYLIPLSQDSVRLVEGVQMDTGRALYSWTTLYFNPPEIEPLGDWHANFSSGPSGFQFTDMNRRRIIVPPIPWD